MKKNIKVGVIGCGNISNAYFTGCKQYPVVEIVQVADLDLERAAAKAAEHGIARHGTVDELLSNPEIDIVLNLTIPRAHAEVNMKILQAGKHVYCEKPFGINREESAPVLELAKQKGLLVTCAPDTFLGPGQQTCRKLIDDGAIGMPTAATAFMASHGPEGWHPNPFFYYDVGGGPMFDMGPYYLTALVNLLGPAKRVNAMVKATFPERVAGRPELNNARIPVKTPTHLAGTIEFCNGAIATVIMSFDIWNHHLPRIEVYGTEGTLCAPDPNTIGDKVSVWKIWDEFPMPITHAETPHRGSAVADLAEAILEGRPPRASGEMAQHVVDIMQSFEESSKSGRHIDLTTTCVQPAALPAL